MARPAAEIDPQLSIFSSNRILPGPIRPLGSRSIRTLSDGNDVGNVVDDLRMAGLFISKSTTGKLDPAGVTADINSKYEDPPEHTVRTDTYSSNCLAPDNSRDVEPLAPLRWRQRCRR